MLKATHYSTMLSLSDCPGCNSLRKEVKNLKDNYDAIKMNHDAIKMNHDAIKMKEASLEAKDQIITIREICRAVEKKIGLEAVGGTVSKMKKAFFCFSKFDSKPTDKANLEAVLTKYQVSADLIMYLKDEGDIATQDDRNKLTVAVLEVALQDDDDDADQVLAKRNFICALHALRMVGSDGIIIVK